MSERKVLNKYYPPDFDPSKIPRAKCGKNRQFTVRLMAPCNMKCYTCGEYIAKGKKFNSRKEDVENMSYLGIRIYRFYIKCPGCLSEISFRTDPESTDYIIEAGAHRNFQALKLAEEQADREAKEVQNEIESNPMLLLENRTQQSQYEMELLESLEDLRELNDRHAGVDLGKVASEYKKLEELSAEQVDAAERMLALKALGYELIEGKMVKTLKEEEVDEKSSLLKRKLPTNDAEFGGGSSSKKSSISSLKSQLAGAVRKKVPSASCNTTQPGSSHLNGKSSEDLSIKDAKSMNALRSSLENEKPLSSNTSETNPVVQSSNALSALCSYSDSD